ncbi:hypothetical protein DPMN_113045 [Dreissena polymorpha]|uniref:Uncharacterized protein n=1 Tax=Dreissena polymorpha TaxID=45954 RepID=A0A9D4KHI7_DREPO|nr:hypothetical protein DPMN_113045 [Dreissena polymorpha]
MKTVKENDDDECYQSRPRTPLNELCRYQDISEAENKYEEDDFDTWIDTLIDETKSYGTATCTAPVPPSPKIIMEEAP